MSATDTLPPPNARPETVARRLFGAISPVLRVLLAAVFLFAAYNKLAVEHGPVMFGQSIKAFELNLPDILVQWATRAVPITEVLLGVLLIVGFWTRSAALALVMLLAFFDLLFEGADFFVDLSDAPIAALRLGKAIRGRLQSGFDLVSHLPGGLCVAAEASE